VDTQSAGHDCLVIADDAESALAEVAAYAEPDLAPAHPDGAAGWAVARRWTAEPVRLAPPRLADLSPRDVGREVARRVVAHLSSVVMRLSPGVTVDVYAPRHRENALPAHGAVTDEALDNTDLALSASALCTFAQTGAAWDWEGPEDAADATADLVSLLAPAMLVETDVGDVLLGHADGSEDIVRLVLTAVWGRVLLGRAQPVTAAHLGALAGYHPSRIRALRAKGEIPGWSAEGSGRGATPCAPEAARQWLASQGVKGV